MRKWLLTAGLWGLVVGLADAQRLTLSGYVTDRATGERLAGATVLDEVSGRGTATNAEGFYTLAFTRRDSLQLVFSFVGYAFEAQGLYLTKSQRHDVSLMAEKMLDEVIIYESHAPSLEQAAEISTLTMRVSTIERLPALGGERDVLKALQLLPGVQAGREGSAGLYVRGGSADQNLIMLDEVPLYQVSHLGGLVSVFNTDALRHVTLIKGGFPARYGGRLSSVLDLRTRDGHARTPQRRVLVGMITSRLTLEGPVRSDSTTTYLVTGRRFMYDLITRPLTRLFTGGFAAGYTFYDLNAKITHRLSDKDRISFSAYAGRDRLAFRFRQRAADDQLTSRMTQTWGNYLAALRWDRVHNPRLLSHTTLSYTQYGLAMQNGYAQRGPAGGQTQKTRFAAGIHDVSARMDFDYFQTETFRLRGGATSTYRIFQPGQVATEWAPFQGPTTTTRSHQRPVHTTENALYAEGLLRPLPPLSINAGLRLMHFHAADTHLISPEPRLAADYQLREGLSLKAGYARMHQAVHALNRTSDWLPVELWLPATRRAVPARSDQYTLGFTLAGLLGWHRYTGSVEAFRKRLDGLIAYRPGSSLMNAVADWQTGLLNDGTGRADGIEVRVAKETGTAQGWISYAYTRSTRQFAELNDGRAFPFQFDRPHDVSVVLLQRISPQVDFSATWVYGTGHPMTLPVRHYTVLSPEGDPTTVSVYEGLNTFRMRDYHRLDVGLSWRKEVRRGLRTWQWSVYNLYNRQNPYFYYFDSVPQQPDRQTLKQVSLFPLMPAVSYQLDF